MSRSAAAVQKRDEDDRLIGSPEVVKLLNIHIITLYRHMKRRPGFPKPIRIGTRLAWWRSEILAYAESKRVA